MEINKGALCEGLVLTVVKLGVGANGAFVPRGVKKAGLVSRWFSPALHLREALTLDVNERLVMVLKCTQSP